MKQTVLGISAIIVLLLAGCSTSAVQTASRKQMAAAVTTAVAKEKAVPMDVGVVGTVETQAAVRVKSQVAGQLLKVYFREGQDVKTGDPLFQIDPRTYDEAIRQAEANMARNVALLRQAEANLKRDTAQEKYARDQASRYQQLFAAGVMSREQAEQYASEADARGEAVRASQAAIESAHAAIRSDEAAVASAKLQRSFCDISSPVDGRTGDLVVEVGNLVRASDAELVTINRIHPIYVTFSVPENRLPDVKKYMAAGKLSVFATLPSDPDQAETGTLTFVDNKVDDTTGTIKLKGSFPNSNNRLWPGQFVNVTLRLTTVSNALVVPLRAVQIGQNGEFAYVVKQDMTAEMRPVVTGLKMADEVVIEKGLASGETVITEGQLRVAPGMRVETKGAGRGSKGARSL